MAWYVVYKGAEGAFGHSGLRGLRGRANRSSSVPLRSEASLGLGPSTMASRDPIAAGPPARLLAAAAVKADFDGTAISDASGDSEYK